MDLSRAAAALQGTLWGRSILVVVAVTVACYLVGLVMGRRSTIALVEDPVSHAPLVTQESRMPPVLPGMLAGLAYVGLTILRNRGE